MLNRSSSENPRPCAATRTATQANILNGRACPQGRHPRGSIERLSQGVPLRFAARDLFLKDPLAAIGQERAAMRLQPLDVPRRPDVAHPHRSIVPKIVGASSTVTRLVEEHRWLQADVGPRHFPRAGPLRKRTLNTSLRSCRARAMDGDPCANPVR